ncbi:MAG: ATP-binding cassette domain-containing protein [Bacteroidota bacterium]
MANDSMEITLRNISKRYLYDWIFRGIDFQFQAPTRYAVLGSNGSGKSTLLKILSGHLSPTKGSIEFRLDGTIINRDDIYQQVSFASPYIDLIEEFTLTEAVAFHQKFKPFYDNLSIKDFLQQIELEAAKDKPVRFFSSGMKQRLKLGLAICSNTQLLLLDEPTATLDEKSVAWFHHLLEQYAHQRLIIIASNEERDVISCQKRLSILDYKKRPK